jgi:hypothetical protein
MFVFNSQSEALHGWERPLRKDGKLAYVFCRRVFESSSFSGTLEVFYEVRKFISLGNNRELIVKLGIDDFPETFGRLR